MGTQSRRGLLKNAAKAAVVATGGTMLGAAAEAKKTSALEKKAYSCKPNADNAPAAPPLFSSAVSYGNLLFLAGVGAHFEGTIEEHTKHVLDELEKKAATDPFQKKLEAFVAADKAGDQDQLKRMIAEFAAGNARTN